MKRVLAILMAIVVVLSSVELPQLKMSVDAAEAVPAGYIGIYTVDDLYLINNNLSGKYMLMNDLDMSSINTSSAVLGFSGIFDGNNHTIKYMCSRVQSLDDIMGTSTKYGGGGLFLAVENGGTISDLSVEVTYASPKSTIVDRTCIGGIAAVLTSEGRIDNCHVKVNGKIERPNVSGTIECYVGGIVGYAPSEEECQIDRCSSEGEINVTLNNNDRLGAGGIVGYARTLTISESFSSVKWAGKSGNGIVGSTYAGIGSSNVSVENCYSIGNGFGDGKIKNSYCVGATLTGSSYQSVYFEKAPGFPSIPGGTTCLTEAQMRQQEMFPDLDFENIWIIVEGDYPYPQLRSNMQDSSKMIDLVEWHQYPTQTTFFTGEEIDVTGGELTLYYQDGTNRNIPLALDMLSDTSFDIMGNKTITITYKDFTVTYSVLINVKPTVVGVTLTSAPTKTAFVKNTAFDFSGSNVHIEYEDATYEDIELTPVMTAGGNISQVGTQTISYTLGDFTVSFDVTVEPIKPVEMNFTSLPTKLTYVEGEEINLDGLKVELLYNNGNKVTTDTYDVSGFTGEVGTNTVTISTQNVSKTFEVEIIPRKAVSISVVTQPTKISYIVGQEFNPTGMVVQATFNDGTTSEITDYTVGEMPTQSGIQPLHVYYDGVEDVFSVSMIAKKVTKIEIARMPYKTNYIEGETFNPDGLKVTITYNDGAVEEVNDYGLSGAITSAVGTKTVTVSYGGKTVNFSINVTAKSAESISVVEPVKKDYLPGETLDLTGMKVLVSYTNGLTAETSAYTVEGFSGTTGTNVVKILSNGFTYSFVVQVHSPADVWVTTQIADCTHGGERVKYCTDCQDVVIREIVAPTAHTKVEEEGQEATCTEPGYTYSATCSVCQTVLKAKEIIPALGHNPATSWETIKTAGCTEKGTQVKKCTRCGIAQVTKDIDARGHHIIEQAAVAATCTTEGLSAGSYCDVCEEVIAAQVIVPTLSHVKSSAWTVTQNATCTENGQRVKKCLLCDTILETEVILQTGHSFANYKSDKNATCLQDGTKTAKCTYCDETDTITDVGSATGHITKLIPGVRATCENSGWTAGYECTVCKEVVTPRKVIAPTGHTEETTWTKVQGATCVQKGITQLLCKDCGAVLDSKESNLIQHNLVKTSRVEASCAKEGNCEYYTCSECHKIFADNKAEEMMIAGDTVLGKAAHTFGSFTSNNNATCTENGTKTRTCKVCGVVETVEDEGTALGHLTRLIPGTLPTCTTAGVSDGYECTICNEIVTHQKNLNPTGHTRADDWVIATESTCLRKGERQLLCIDCGEVLASTELEQSKHTMVEHFAVAAGCETAGNIRYWSCSVCDSLFADENASNIISLEAAILHARGHENVTYHDKKDANYSECGNPEYWHCEDCGKNFADEALTGELNEEQITLHVKAIVAKQKIDISNWFETNEPIAKYTVYPKATASVTAKGILTAKQAGKITVTAYVKRGKEFIPLDEKISIQVEKPEFEFDIVPDSRGQVIQASDYMPGLKNAVVTSWSVPASKSPVVTIDAQTGEITVLKSGTVKVTAVFGEGASVTKYTTSLKVKLPTVSKAKLSLTAGKTSKLTVKNTTKQPSEWVSDNESVAKIDANGTVTAVGKGTATVSAIVDGVNYDCVVTVK